MFDRARDAVGPAPEVGAVDLDGFSGRGVPVNHGEATRDRAAVGFRVEAQLLPRQPVHRRHGLDVVHDGVRFGLFVEAAIPPVLADVIDLALGGEVIMLDHRPGGGHQTEGLRERSRGAYRQRTRLARIAKLEIAFRLVINDVVKTTDRKPDVRQLAVRDAGTDLSGDRFDQRDGLVIQIVARGIGAGLFHGPGLCVVRLLWSTSSSFLTVESRSSLLRARMSCRATPMCGRYFSM
ncbi:hypothetical protein GALL_549900 [mine drainage metagenome]|uniref:Uncharacterized protein n=1 Tax=mine drainage metagenome TaxID=410659 RepID=A0A1J5P7N0_9ZZZZ